jgi:predicted nuclease of predicted toxin-antitoxin system
LRFLIDAQLPPALVKLLVAAGHQAEHVFDLGLKQAHDRDIWERVKLTKSVLISKDEDFVVMRILEAGGPSIVWIRLGNVRKHVLLAKFTDALPGILQALAVEDNVVELT